MDIFFCQNCEKAILNVKKYTIYEGLCKECYYRRVYQEDMTPEQIDWIQPKEDIVTINIPGCEPLKCSVDDITIIDARLREKNKDFNER